jgi:hypothetical protein
MLPFSNAPSGPEGYLDGLFAFVHDRWDHLPVDGRHLQPLPPGLPSRFILLPFLPTGS